MTKKGFTLVELLSVIVIMSLLIAIAVPSTMAISSRIKNKLLDTKLTLTEKNAVLWAQDNKNLFYPNNTCASSYTHPMVNSSYVFAARCKCYSTTDNTTAVTNDTWIRKVCSITMGKLASEGYLDYDNGNKIQNPKNNVKCLNNFQIVITYNRKNKTFSAVRAKDASTLANNDAYFNCP